MADSTMSPFMPAEDAMPPDPAEVERQLRLLQALATMNGSEAYRRGDSLPQYLGDTAAGAVGGLTTVPQMIGDAAGWGINKLDLAPNVEPSRAPFQAIPEIEEMKARNPVAALGGTMASPGLGPFASMAGKAVNAVGGLPAAGKVALGGGAGLGAAAALSTPGEAQRRPAAQAANPEIRAVQQELANRGIPVGPVDGLMGPKTGDAIKTFQQLYGIEPTGILDPKTTLQIRKLDPNYQPSAEEQTALAERDSAAKMRAAEAAKAAAEAEAATQQTKSSGQWDQLLQRAIPYGVGAGLGVGGAAILAGLQKKIGLGRVGDFNKLAERIGQRHDSAPAGNLVGTKVGDDMIADLNSAYATGGQKAPFTADRLAHTIEGTPEAVAASAGKQYGGYASREGMEAAIGNDLRRQSPFAEAPAGGAAQAEAAQLAKSITDRRSAPAAGGEQFFEKNPATLGKLGDNLVPIVGATDYAAAKGAGYMSDDPATKDAMDKLASGGLGMMMAGGGAQKILSTAAKASTKGAMSKSAEPAVTSARMRMERDLGSYVPGGTKAAVAIRNPVGKQTPAEIKAAGEAGRAAKTAIRTQMGALQANPATAQWLEQNKGLGPVQKLRAFEADHGVRLNQRQLGDLEGRIGRATAEKGVASAVEKLKADVQAHIAQDPSVAAAFAMPGNQAVKQVTQLKGLYVQKYPELANMTPRRINQVIREAVEGK